MNETISTNVPPAVPYDVIPAKHSARTLVACFDGTGDSFDGDNSNVVQFFSALQKDNRCDQMVYYQSGIGTYTVPEIFTPMAANVSKTLDLMFAWNISSHVMEGYRFIMENYICGDKICIFGFSRGAYTARVLAGMIHKVGLLPPSNVQQVPFAYQMFSREDAVGWKLSNAFKRSFCIDVDIEFLGVWDTVSSVGLIPKRLPFTSSNYSIKTFRHAISLDEHRAKFKPNFYQRPTEKQQKLGMQPGEMPKSTVVVPYNTSSYGAVNGVPLKLQEVVNGEHKATHNTKKRLTEYEAAFDAATPGMVDATDVLEVWFAGCHCDVGGGSVSNETRHSLARIPLRWMVRQCFLANTGILFHRSGLAAMGIDPDTLYPVVKPRPPPKYYTPPQPAPASAPDASSGMNKTLRNTWSKLSDFVECISGGGKDKGNSAVKIGQGNIASGSVLDEEEEDLCDALCPIYDQLKIKPLWWLLEVIPMKTKVQRKDNDEWEERWMINCGRGRVIPRQKHESVYVHRSVKTRLEAGKAVQGGQYVPKARWTVPPTWVE